MPGRNRTLSSRHHPPTRSLARTSALNELRALRMKAQCLAPRLPRHSLVDVVQALCGVNAQLPSAMALSLRARVEGLTLEDIETSRVKDRTVVRTWCMRGTMHLLAAEDLDWLLSAIAPAEIRSGWRWLDKRGGLERPRAEKVLDAAYKTLKAKGPMTRSDLMAALADEFGPQVKSAAAGVVQLNGLLGRVCFGPNQGAEPTYVALDQWLGRPVRVSKTLDYSALARRYLRGYGPAAPRDLAAWWGMGLREAKTACALLQKELIELNVAGESAWLLAADAAALEESLHPNHTVRLLPAFDTYLLGYENREFAVPAQHRRRIFHGGEMVPTILVDGCAAGTWRYAQRGKQILIRAAPFSSFATPIRELIAQEADDIGRFFGRMVTLRFTQEDELE